MTALQSTRNCTTTATGEPSSPFHLTATLIAALKEAIVDHESELTSLDQAVGDGDHGANLRRGFDAIAAISADISTLEFGPALHKAGMTLVMKVGGASGPLYGSLFMAMGKLMPKTPTSRQQVAEMLSAGIDAVKSRGKSDAGEKTMLDVLIPLHAALVTTGDLAQIRAAADTACETTREMRATKGRAAYLGERSIGHIDPGARSTALIVNTVCAVLEEK